MESASAELVSRKEKRKALKKDKRKQIRKELAEKARAEEEARLNDPEVQREIQLEEEREKERLERERKEFEERERIFLEDLERKKKEEEEEDERMNELKLQLIQLEEEREKERLERERKEFEERERIFLEDLERKKKEEEEEDERMNELKLQLVGTEEGSNEDDEWEYVEEGPPEIIWQGNEIIVKKNKVKVKKKDINQDIKKEDPNRPTSNPLPPQHEAYASFKNAPITSAELLDTVAQQVPNFGTEQDKAHCPFHIKTGACRFGSHCNRVHYYPDKSNTLLIKSMYNGPGLAWEQDEGLEVCWLQAVILYTEEEVERSYEDFYEDVHTEFLKFGEIINFKVCRNGSFHLRGNVYVHYKSLDSAVMAYGSVHGRYFAAKQVKCEFVSLTRWKVAICGEYMKSMLKTCSRGSACNFLHCFSNPGGDYEWADCDKPPPRYWVKKMTALFGYSDQPSPKDQRHSSRIFTSDKDSYHSKRHRSIDPSQHNGSSSRSHRDETHERKSRRREHQKDHKVYENESEHNINHTDTDSDGDRFDRDSYHSKRHRSIDSSQHNGSSSRGHHEETHARKSRHRSRQEDHTVYEDETEYKNKSNYLETDSDGDRLDRKRYDDLSENRIRKESKPRDNRKRTPSSRGSSSDENLYMKRKSRHRKNISESSSTDAKTEHSQGKLRHKQKTKSSRRRSQHDDRDEVDREESKKVEVHSRHRPSRRSHESEPKSDTSDRWQPHDNEISDDREPKDRRIDHGTRSGDVVEDALKDIQHSRDRDDKKREKRKRI